ncbi:hypothetical protein PGB90_009498 [Kerria lacca]
MFKEIFKYYKRKTPEPNLENVLKIQDDDPRIFSKCEILVQDCFDNEEAIELGLKHISKWRIYELKQHSGLIIIVNPFTNLGQRYWIARSVADYSDSPSVTNLQNHNDLCLLLNNKPFITNKLRWATMGYHHNWNTKVYSEEAKGPFPSDLSRLSKFIVKTILNINFDPEASIVNYYLMDSFLSGHTDCSETNVTAPLVSFSFGQTAIFLIGGDTLNESPDAIFLESGDIVLMVGNSRFSYHGVPKIIRSRYEYWNDFTENDANKNFIIKNESLHNQNTNKHVEYIAYGGFERVTMEKVANTEYWRPFASYIKNARINLNIRQVFFPETDNVKS